MSATLPGRAAALGSAARSRVLLAVAGAAMLVMVANAGATSPGASCAWTSPAILRAQFGLDFRATLTHPAVLGNGNDCRYEALTATTEWTLEFGYTVFGASTAQAGYDQVKGQAGMTFTIVPGLGRTQHNGQSDFGTLNGKPGPTAYIVTRSALGSASASLQIADGTNSFEVILDDYEPPGYKAKPQMRTIPALLVKQLETIAATLVPKFYNAVY